MLERLEPDLLLVKETHIFYDVFVSILDKQSVSCPSVRDTGASSVTGG